MASGVLSLLLTFAFVNFVVVSGLSCYQCDTAKDGKSCETLENMNSKQCNQSFHDICYVIVTNSQEPNNGPQDRLKDNDEHTTYSRGCGDKKGLERFAKLKKNCYKDSIGGGGTQEQCVCAGNDCNTATSTQATLGLVLAALLFKNLL